MKNIIKRFSALVILSTLLISATPLQLTAQGSYSEQFTLPSSARAINATTYDLGTKKDPTTGKLVHGIAFVTPRSHSEKSSNRPGGGTAGSACFSLLSSGMKWKNVEPWVADTSNNQGLDGVTVFNRLSANLQTWENAAGAQIFGNGTQSSGLSAETAGAPDGKNELMFGNIDEPNVIAVTITWGYYSGPPNQRAIVEWDQIYNQNDFEWSLSGQPDKMDFDNIATHEIGHAAGLGHPENACSEETMYAYADNGETKKRSLGAGDMTGINKLY